MYVHGQHTQVLTKTRVNRYLILNLTLRPKKLRMQRKNCHASTIGVLRLKRKNEWNVGPARQRLVSSSNISNRFQ